MNRKISMVLTLSMLVNVFAYAGSLAFAESSEVVDGQSTWWLKKSYQVTILKERM
ncbi:MAG: hypothetical protein ACTTIQ_05600 [Peptostreptococcus stomatis]